MRGSHDGEVAACSTFFMLGRAAFFSVKVASGPRKGYFVLSLHEIFYNSAVTVLAQVQEGSINSWLVQVLYEQRVRSSGVTMTIFFWGVDKVTYVSVASIVGRAEDKAQRGLC
jgi:hypothetical protein